MTTTGYGTAKAAPYRLSGEAVSMPDSPGLPSIATGVLAPSAGSPGLAAILPGAGAIGSTGSISADDAARLAG